MQTIKWKANEPNLSEHNRSMDENNFYKYYDVKIKPRYIVHYTFVWGVIRDN